MLTSFGRSFLADSNLGDLEDAVHQEAVLAIGLHAQFDQSSVADALAIADDKLLPRCEPAEG